MRPRRATGGRSIGASLTTRARGAAVALAIVLGSAVPGLAQPPGGTAPTGLPPGSPVAAVPCAAGGASEGLPTLDAGPGVLAPSSDPDKRGFWLGARWDNGLRFES